MNTKEFVEKYVGECYAKLIKFIIIQLILDFLEIVVFVFTLIREIDRQSNLYITIVSFVMILMVTVLLNIIMTFGGFKTFVKNVNIYRSYSDAVVEFQKTNNQAIFNEKLYELELKIKKQ